jgi:regulator of protease activity HflC (stomatin/prohibitin superfamily)
MNYLTLFGVTAIIALTAIAIVMVIRKFRHVFCVPEGFAGLVYHHGLYVRRNNAGRHIIWGCGWSIEQVDVRKAYFCVSGESFITADNIYVKITPHISYQITDPARASHETQHWPNDIYHAVLRALHAVLASLSYEAFCNQQLEIGPRLLAHVQPEAAKIGINILAVDLRCLIFPAEPNCVFISIQSGGLVPLKQYFNPVVPEDHEAK